MQVMPLQEMQHAGEFVAAVADLGTRRCCQKLERCLLQIEGGGFGGTDPSYRGRVIWRVCNSPSRSI